MGENRRVWGRGDCQARGTEEGLREFRWKRLNGWGRQGAWRISKVKENSVEERNFNWALQDQQKLLNKIK